MAGINDDARPTLDDLEARADAAGTDYFVFLVAWTIIRRAERNL